MYLPTSPIAFAGKGSVTNWEANSQLAVLRGLCSPAKTFGQVEASAVTSGLPWRRTGASSLRASAGVPSASSANSWIASPVDLDHARQPPVGRRGLTLPGV